MGVIYKLKKEIADFILEQKRLQPHLSCRSISRIAEERFQVKVSKSSINSIIKAAGLSMPVGRRAKRKRKSRLIQAMPQIEENLSKLLEKAPAATTAPEKKPEEIKPPLPEPIPEKPIIQPVSETSLASTEKKELKPPQEIPPQPKPEEIVKMPPTAVPEERIAGKEPQKPVEEQPLPDKGTPEKIIPAAAPVPKPEEIVVAKEPAKEKETTIPKVEIDWLPEEEIEEIPELPCNGVMILKAADYLLGLSRLIRQAVVWRLGLRLTLKEESLLSRTEGLIYQSLFSRERNSPEEPRSFWALIDKKIPWENLDKYAEILKSDKTLSSEINLMLSEAVKDVRCIQVNFSDRSTIYLDGQLHTIWSTQYLPYDFSSPLQHISSYVDSCFLKGEPLLFFTAPGYDVPPKEFFTFLYSQENPQKQIAKIILLNNKFGELKTVPVPEHATKRFFIFGMWPWQFVEYRRVIKLGEFKSFHFESLEKEIYLADVEIELFGPTMQTSVILRGFALKTTLAEKTRLLILTNLDAGQIKPDYLVNLYMGRWPNLEEGFQDYSRKIERFTYTANTERCFAADNEKLYTISQDSDINTSLKNYLLSLDLYSRWRFLPRGYEDSDFEVAKERFYNLQMILTKKIGYIKASFMVTKEYPYLNDLEYACRRLNECQIELSEGKPLRFSYIIPK